MNASLSNTVDTLLKQSTESGDLPGVIAVLADDSGVIYQGASGKRALGGEADFTLDTVCWFASMTKAVTAAAAMQLVEQGKLSLDQPAAKICPELDELQVLEGFDDKGEAKLRPPVSRITLRQLLTHTCGSSYEFNDPNILRWIETTATPGIISGTRASMMRPLICDPGTRWSYGMGIDWAGRMVENASGQRLGDYLRDHLFAPLGMNSTGFKITPEGRAKLAGVHARGPDGSLANLPFEVPQDAEFEMGGHALYGPLTDYIRFLQMILGGGVLDGVRVLEAGTVAQMSKNNTGALSMERMHSYTPHLWRDADFFPGIEFKYGLSYAINMAPIPGGRSAGSLTWAGLANSYYWIDPAKRVTGVVLTQILPFLDEKVLALCGAIEQATYRSLEPAGVPA